MTETRTLPHDAYITAITDALSLALLTPVEYWTSDGETRGVYCHLNAVITLDPSGTYELDDEDIPAGTPWRHGLILIWEWHTGLEEGGDPEKGPLWEWARLVDSHGQSGERHGFTSLGYPSPAYVVESVRALIERRNQSTPAERWEHADELDAACEAWGADEGGERREPCGEGHCRCDGQGAEHADCACGCDCPRDEDGQLIDE